MSEPTNHVNAYPDSKGFHRVTLAGIGVYVTAGLDGEGLPYVSINTEDMAANHVYDEHTGLLGTARPYRVEVDDQDAVVVFDPTGETVARHYRSPGVPVARLAAKQHADLLNGEWHKRCGMPVISVHLNDGAEVYDARDHNPALRFEEEEVEADA